MNPRPVLGQDLDGSWHVATAVTYPSTMDTRCGKVAARAIAFFAGGEPSDIPALRVLRCTVCLPTTKEK